MYEEIDASGGGERFVKSAAGGNQWPLPTLVGDGRDGVV